MREHEVPTHVQAEDRVLLWLTFPQIVAVTAVCGPLLRGVPLRPLWTLGGAHGARRSSRSVRSRHGRGKDRRKEAAPGGSGPAEVLARSTPVCRTGRRTGSERGSAAAAEHAGSRGADGETGEAQSPQDAEEEAGGPNAVQGAPLVRQAQKTHRRRESGQGKARRWKRWRIALALAVVAAAAWSMPGPALADGHTLDEVDFRPPERVLGRRLFVRDCG